MTTHDYNLFWREEHGYYELRDGEKVLGILPDTGNFAGDVMSAFNDQQQIAELRTRAARILESAKFVADEIAELI